MPAVWPCTFFLWYIQWLVNLSRPRSTLWVKKIPAKFLIVIITIFFFSFSSTLLRSEGSTNMLIWVFFCGIGLQFPPLFSSVTFLLPTIYITFNTHFFASKEMLIFVSNFQIQCFFGFPCHILRRILKHFHIFNILKLVWCWHFQYLVRIWDFSISSREENIKTVKYLNIVDIKNTAVMILLKDVVKNDS